MPQASTPEPGADVNVHVQALVSSLGWTYLDVRSKLETEDVGKVKIAVNIPCVNCTKKWNSEQGKKVIQKEENEAFLDMVRIAMTLQDAILTSGALRWHNCAQDGMACSNCPGGCGSC